MRHKLGLLAGIALLCAMAFSTPSLAQNANTQALVVTTCGTQSWGVGGWSAITQTAAGALCTSGGGGGGGATVGAANFTPAQVSVGATATVIAAARTGAAGTGRVSITITNTTTTAIYLGGSGVTTSTGTMLPGVVGASVTINTTAAVYGIVATGTATVTEFETY